MATEGWETKGATLNESKRSPNSTKKKKSKSSERLRSGSTASEFAKDVASQDVGPRDTEHSSESIGRYIQEQERNFVAKDDGASTSTATTGNSTTVSAATFASEALPISHSQSNTSPLWDSPIPLFDKFGNALTPEDRAIIARKRGVCLKCGIIKTHVTMFVISRRTAINNSDVYQGICIRCNPKNVPPKVYSRWQQQQNQPSPSPRKVRFFDNCRSAPGGGKKLERTLSTPIRVGDQQRKNIQRHSSEGNFGSQNSPHLTMIMRHLSTQDYVSFLDELESLSIEANPTIVASLKAFRTRVTKDQLSNPEAPVLASDKWVDTMVSRMKSTDQEVLVQCLLTFLTFSTLPGNYRKSMMHKGAMKAIYSVLDSMHGYGNAKVVACAVVSSMSVHEQTGHTFCPGRQTILKVGEIVVSNKATSTRDSALQALYHVANQTEVSGHQRDTTNKDTLSDLLLEEQSTFHSVVGIIGDNRTRTNTLNAALRLLWRCSELSSAFKPTETLIRAILTAMSRNTDKPVVLEAGAGLLANLTLSPSFPVHYVLEVCDVLCNGFSKPKIIFDELVAVVRMNAICNLVSDPTRRGTIRTDRELIEVVVDQLARFINLDKVLDLCCQTICYVCASSNTCMQLFIEKGGIECLVSSWQTHTLMRDNPSIERKLLLARVLRRCSEHQNGAHKMHHAKLLDTFTVLSRNERDDSVKVVLQTIIRNILIAEAVDVSSSYSDFEASPLRTLASGESMPSPPTSEEAIMKILLAMKRSIGFPVIQLEGCRILSEIYYTCAETQPPNPSGSLRFSVTHYQDAIDTLRSALRKHRDNGEIQYLACCAMLNLLIPLCRGEISSEEVQDVSQSTNASLNDVMDALILGEKNADVAKSAIHLFTVLCYICNKGYLDIFMPKIMDRIFDAMTRFIDLSEAIISFHPKMLTYIGSRRGITALLATLRCEDVKIVAMSSSVLADLLGTGELSSGSALEIFRSMSLLTGCVTRYPSNAVIQANLCSVLESLVSLEAFETQGLINACGASEALCEALSTHSTDDDVAKQNVVKYLCRALTCTIPSLHSATLKSMAIQLGEALGRIFEIGLQDEEMSSTAVETLLACCRRDPYTQRVLVDDSSCLEPSVRAMRYHLGCKKLQMNGCRIISSCCDAEYRMEAIGEFGGVEAVTDGLLAHSGNGELQIEGLSALRRLALCSANRSRIARSSAETAISCAVQIHLRNPRVICEAFFARTCTMIDFEDGTVQVSTLSDQELSYILIGMRQFAIDGAVCESACALLKVCSSLVSNLETMKNRSSELIPLLFRAARAFPDHCKEAVLTIFTVLEAEFPNVTRVESLQTKSTGTENDKGRETKGSDDIVVLEGQRDAPVKIKGFDDVVRNDFVYLRRKKLSKSQVAYQRLRFADRRDSRFAIARSKASHECHTFICSRLHRNAGADFYEHPKMSEHGRDLVVIKKFNMDHWENQSELKFSPAREASILLELRGKIDCIVNCLEVLRIDSSLYLVLELPGLDAFGYQTLQPRLLPVSLALTESFGNRVFDESTVKSLFLKIVNQVQKLHNESFCHGRLEPASILEMGSNGVFLAEFAASFRVSIDSANGLPLLSRPPECSLEANNSYVSPEMYRRVELDGFAADVWSLGSLLFALLTGSNLCSIPHDSDKRYGLFILSNGLRCDGAIDAMMKQLLRESPNASRDALWLAILGIKRLSLTARELLADVLRVDPSERLTLNQIVSHCWLRHEDGDVFLEDTHHSSTGNGSTENGNGEGGTDQITFRGSGGRAGSSKNSKRQQRQGAQKQRRGRQQRGRSNGSEDNGNSDSGDLDSGRGDRTGDRNNKGYSKNRPSDRSNRWDFMTLVQSSPLAYCSPNGEFYPMDQLNIHEERRVLNEAIQDSGARIKIVYEIATADRLGSFLSKGDGRILHFSGHGHPRYLAIEDGWGAMQPLGVEQLEEWISLGGNKDGTPNKNGLEFVFVSACCSRSIGNAFIAAGVEHVVCVEKDTQQIRVETAVAFQKAFYRALACGKSLRQAFDRARQEILLSSILSKDELQEEVEKFCLLPLDGDHDVPIFFSEDHPPMSPLHNTCQLRRPTRIPMPPAIFIGRQVETYQIVRALRRARLVRVSGGKGIGKKALVKFTARFIDDRRHILGFNEILWFPSLVHSPDGRLGYLFDNLFDRSQSSKELACDINKIIKCLYDRRALLVLEANGNSMVSIFLAKLFEHNQSVKVILIHSSEDEGRSDQNMPCAEWHLQVPKLDIESNLLLFCTMCARVEHSKRLYDLLLRSYVEKRLWREDIENMIGGGNPRDILWAAKDMSEENFQKLLDISRRRALHLKFSSRVSLLSKQNQLRKELSEAVRKNNFVRAGDLQYMCDEIERLKDEDFPDLRVLERKSKDLETQIDNAANSSLWGSAQTLRHELDNVTFKIEQEKKAIIETSAKDEEPDLSIKQLGEIIKALNCKLRQTLNEDNYPAAKDISEKIERYDRLKSEKECEESLSTSIHKLEKDLAQAKSKLDLAAAEEIHFRLEEEKISLSKIFGGFSRLSKH